MKQQINNNVDKNANINNGKTSKSKSISINKYQNKDINCKFMNEKMPYIIAVTAHALNEDRSKYLNMGFNDFIAKPVNIKMLYESMNTFIDSLLF